MLDNRENFDKNNLPDDVTFTVARVNKKKTDTLMDSGADLNFMDLLAAKRRNLMILPVNKTIQLANSQLSDVIGEAIVDVEINGKLYKGLVVQIMKNMFVDLILGKEFLKRHKSVTFHFDGSEESLHIGNTTCMKFNSSCASATDKSDRLIPSIADVSDTCQLN